MHRPRLHAAWVLRFLSTVGMTVAAPLVSQCACCYHDSLLLAISNLASWKQGSKCTTDQVRCMSRDVGMAITPVPKIRIPPLIKKREAQLGIEIQSEHSIYML